MRAIPSKRVPPRVMVIYGTRPEAIKVAPLIKRLEADPDLECMPVVTGQHREMLEHVNTLFDIQPLHDLRLMRPGQTLVGLTTRAMSGLERIVRADRPDVVVVQGDTSTSFAGALTAFLHGIPIVHLEAGLRTGDLASPFPEEGNRRLTAAVTSLHLAPTSRAEASLVAENIPAADVLVTGNTVIDALQHVAHTIGEEASPSVGDKEYVLITVHRRESWGRPLTGIAEAIRALADKRPDLDFVLPLHANPMVRETLRPVLAGMRNVRLIQAQAYRPFIQLLKGCRLVLTDSGGIQEEAPGLGKPVLVMRDTTERPEAIEAGTSRLVGTEPASIVEGVMALLSDEKQYQVMSTAANPFGDGRASERSVTAIKHLLALGPAPAPFRSL